MLHVNPKMLPRLDELEDDLQRRGRRAVDEGAAERGYRLVPGHHPDVWPRLTAEPAAQREPG